MENFAKVFKAAQDMQKKMQEIQEEIRNSEFSGDSGGGLVKATVNGKHELVGIEVDDSLINVDEKDIMFDLIIASVNNANANLKETSTKKMEEIQSSMGLPKGMDLPDLF